MTDLLLEGLELQRHSMIDISFSLTSYRCHANSYDIMTWICTFAFRMTVRQGGRVWIVARIKSTLTRLTKSCWEFSFHRRRGGEGVGIRERDAGEERSTALQGGTFDRVSPRKHSVVIEILRARRPACAASVTDTPGTYLYNWHIGRYIFHNALNATGPTSEIIRSEECIRLSPRDLRRKNRNGGQK